MQIRTCRLICFLILLASVTTNAQSFQWAKSIQSAGFDEGYDLVTDPAGNSYIAGMLEFDTDFGNGVVLSSAGIHDIFLAKYSPTGRLVWDCTISAMLVRHALPARSASETLARAA